MRISIITVVYNSVHTVMDAVRSVRSQSHPDIEYIMIDGASTDGTTELLEQNESLFDRFVSEKDDGLYDAINKGIGMASGDFVGLMHADDLYADNQVVADLVNLLQMQKADSIYGDLVYVKRDDPAQVVRKWSAGDYHQRKFLFGWMPPHPTFYIRRERLEETGLYDPSFQSAADYEFLLRSLYKHKVTSAYLPRVLVKMRVGGKSNATLGNRLRANRQDSRAWRANGLKPYWFTRYAKPARKILQFR